MPKSVIILYILGLISNQVTFAAITSLNIGNPMAAAFNGAPLKGNENPVYIELIESNDNKKCRQYRIVFQNPAIQNYTLHLRESSKEWLSPHYTQRIYESGDRVTFHSHPRTLAAKNRSSNVIYRDLDTMHPINCFYEGHILELNESWVILNDCDNRGHFRGMIVAGNESWYLEPVLHEGFEKRIQRGSVPHRLVNYDEHTTLNVLTPANYTGRENDVESRKRRALPIHESLFADQYLPSSEGGSKRLRRDLKLSQYHGPSPLIIELYIVNDHSQYLRWEQNEGTVISRTLELAHTLNAMFKQLNIFVALVGTEVWKDKDHIVISEDGDQTLKNFNTYRQNVLLPRTPHDNAQLLTATYFKGGVVGKAIKRQICAHSDSTGVAMDHNKLIGPVASTMAHELGHSLGMDHDTEICKCPDKSCIMTPASGAFVPTRWSSCSLEYLEYSIAQGMDACLYNKPARVYDTPFCGNGFVEDGEQCDCGLAQFCETKCCDPHTCKLTKNSTCATGACCNFYTCQPRPRASMCRKGKSVCDLPEYCDGRSEFCPPDVHVQNGQECTEPYTHKEPEYPAISTPHYTKPTEKITPSNSLKSRAAREDENYGIYSKAYCYAGKCNSYESQCKLLWGHTGHMSGQICYQQNVKGTIHNGDCGYSIKYDRYKACPSDDYMCGRLHCTSEAEKVTYGDTSGRREGHSYIRFGRDKFYTCHSVFIDLGLDTADAGMVPDGASCGADKLCVNTSCVPKSKLDIKACHKNCHGNGICNSKNRCHCNPGYGPPFCDKPGAGGSIDSGPALNTKRVKPWIVGLLVLFLCVIPFICLILFFVRQCTSFFKSANKRSTHRRHFRASLMSLLPCLNAAYFESKKQKFHHSSTSTGGAPKAMETAKSPDKKMGSVLKQKSKNPKFAISANKNLTNDHIQHVFMNQNQLLSEWPRSDIVPTSGAPKSQGPPPPWDPKAKLLIDDKRFQQPQLIVKAHPTLLLNVSNSANIIQPIRPAPAPPSVLTQTKLPTINALASKQQVRDQAGALFEAKRTTPLLKNNERCAKASRSSSSTARNKEGGSAKRRGKASVKRSESTVRPNAQPPQPPTVALSADADTGWNINAPVSNIDFRNSNRLNDPIPPGPVYQNVQIPKPITLPLPPRLRSNNNNGAPAENNGQQSLIPQVTTSPNTGSKTTPKRTESTVSRLAKKFESGKTNEESLDL